MSLFVTNGYGQVTIDEIAIASHVTKRTIYTYFGDKAEVFTAAVERFRIRALAELESQEGLLEDVAARLVHVLHSDEAVGLHRLMIGESAQFPELAARFYESGPRGYIDLLARRLRSEVTFRSVPTPRPSGDLAEALFGLLLGEAHRKRLLGLCPEPSTATARHHAIAALSALQIVSGAEN